MSSIDSCRLRSQGPYARPIFTLILDSSAIARFGALFRLSLMCRCGIAVGLLIFAIGQAEAANRHAFVVGIDNYRNLQPLVKARNDAQAVAERLSALRYQVTIGLDADRKEFYVLYDGMLSQVRPGDEVLFYFAGHGVELQGGRILLLPADTPSVTADGERLLERESISLDRVVHDLVEKGVRLSIVIVDACRENPFPREGTRSVGITTRGLGRQSGAPGNVFMLFSAGANQLALDRLGEQDLDPNSVFTRVLLPLLDLPDLSLLELAKRLQSEVHRLASTKAGGHLQLPAYYDGFLDSHRWNLLRGTLERAIADKPKDKVGQGHVLRLGEGFRDCSDCPEMVAVRSGRFLMGSAEDELRAAHDLGVEKSYTDWELPQTEVRLDRPFLIARTEVTVAQFRAFVSATAYRTDAERFESEGCRIHDESVNWGWRSGHSWIKPGYKQGDDHPVTCVSWNDAKAYVAWLSERTGRPYRLPSEAEWEYAARAGTTSAVYWGDETADACTHENVADWSLGAQVAEDVLFPVHDCDDGYAQTSPVGATAGNGFALQDMIGNVSEWVEDCWRSDHVGRDVNGAAYTEEGCRTFAIRGGSWSSWPGVARSAARNRGSASIRQNDTGFRAALSVP